MFSCIYLSMFSIYCIFSYSSAEWMFSFTHCDISVFFQLFFVFNLFLFSISACIVFITLFNKHNFDWLIDCLIDLIYLSVSLFCLCFLSYLSMFSLSSFSIFWVMRAVALSVLNKTCNLIKIEEKRIIKTVCNSLSNHD